MSKFILNMAVMAVLGSGFAGQATAQDEPAKAENPVIVAHNKFVADLDEASTRHFNIMYSNYNMARVVDTVRDSVDNAVDSCAENNPDMEEALNTRFDAWKDAVAPVMKDADAHINNMMFAQDYAKPKEIKKIFKLIDKTRKAKEKEAKRVPVTTPEACTYLLERMDATQDSMIKLLRATLMSLPGKIQAEQEDAAKAAAEAE